MSWIRVGPVGFQSRSSRVWVLDADMSSAKKDLEADQVSAELGVAGGAATAQRTGLISPV